MPPSSVETSQDSALKFPAENLPTPRLELAWEHIEDNDYRFEYVLVIRLRDYDIRIPKGHEGCEHRVPMSPGGTAIRGRAPDYYEVIDTPFRDGAHARWDSQHLSGLPIFATFNGIASRIVPVPQQVSDK